MKKLSREEQKEKMKKTKLTKEEIREIRLVYSRGHLTQSCLADCYDVSVDIIYNIVHYRTNKNI